MLAQFVHQLLEALLRLATLEVVGLQFAHLASQIVRQHVEAEVALGRGIAGRLGTSFVAAPLGVRSCLLNCVAFFIDDVVERVGDLLVDTAEVVLVEALLTFLAQLVEHLAQTLHALAVAIVHTLLHHLAQRSVDVAVIQQVVRQRVEQRVRIEIEPFLRAIPARIGEPTDHSCNLHRTVQGRSGGEQPMTPL